MVVFGYSGKITGCIRKRVVLFRQDGCIWIKVVVLDKSGCIQANVVVFGQNWLYSGRVVELEEKGCVRKRVVVFSGKSGRIR